MRGCRFACCSPVLLGDVKTFDPELHCVVLIAVHVFAVVIAAVAVTIPVGSIAAVVLRVYLVMDLVEVVMEACRWKSCVLGVV